MVNFKILGYFTMYTDTQKNEFLILRAQGFSFEKISQKLNVPIRTLFRWAKNNAEAISILKDTAFEALMETLKVNSGGRLRMLASDLDELNKAIKKESFNSLHLSDMLKLKVKYINELSKFDSHYGTYSLDEIPNSDSEDDYNPDEHIEKIIKSTEKNITKNPLILDAIKFEKELNEELNLFSKTNENKKNEA
ncbi:MAG TPA: helix-turn-helix domain-containing protein [Ignavibacteria bacterium]|jgi:3-methyladenine DNA glycosylase AlkD